MDTPVRIYEWRDVDMIIHHYWGNYHSGGDVCLFHDQANLALWNAAEERSDGVLCHAVSVYYKNSNYYQ